MRAVLAGGGRLALTVGLGSAVLLGGAGAIATVAALNRDAPENRLPENRLPENRLPKNRGPENQRPERVEPSPDPFGDGKPDLAPEPAPDLESPLASDPAAIAPRSVFAPLVRSESSPGDRETGRPTWRSRWNRWRRRRAAAWRNGSARLGRLGSTGDRRGDSPGETRRDRAEGSQFDPDDPFPAIPPVSAPDPEPGTEPDAAPSNAPSNAPSDAPNAETLAPEPAADSAAATVPLTLEAAIALTLANNRDLKNAYLQRLVDRENLALAEDRFRPIFEPEILLNAGRDRERLLVTGDNLFTTRADLESNANVEWLVPTGGRLRFGWRSRYDTAASRLDSREFLRQTFEFSFDQPLLKGAGEAVNRAPVEIARLQEAQQVLDLQATLIERVATTIRAYRGLLQAQGSLAIARESLALAQEQLRFNEGLVEARRRARVELEADRANVSDRELQVLSARNRLQQARVALLQVLDVDEDWPVEASDRPELPPQEELDAEVLLATALANNPRYLRAQLDRRIREYELLVADDARQWDLSLGLGYNGTYSDLPEENARWNARLRLFHRVGDRAPQRNFRAAQVSLAQTENDLVERSATLRLDVLDLVRQVELNFAQVQGARDTVRLRERTLAIEQEKVQLGTDDAPNSIELGRLQTDVSQAQNGLLNAQIGYLNTRTELRETLGTLLEFWDAAPADPPELP